MSLTKSEVRIISWDIFSLQSREVCYCDRLYYIWLHTRIYTLIKNINEKSRGEKKIVENQL